MRQVSHEMAEMHIQTCRSVLPALRLFFALAATFTIPCRAALAVQVAAGVSTVDDGDDRLRPALLGHLGIGQAFYARYFYYGRKFATVTEKTHLGSLNYRFPVFGTAWFGGVGLAQLAESTRIKDNTGVEEDIDETNYNTGIALGFFWSPPIKPVMVTVGWESHLFPAGEAGIFLSTGRKETLSVALGFQMQ